MKIFDAYITPKVLDYLSGSLKENSRFESANEQLCQFSGVLNFFADQFEFEEMIKQLESSVNILSEPDRSEYGDFQTNAELASKICAHLQENSFSPDIIIEPTCGRGAFILASLKAFPHAQKIFGGEIYKPYLWETKFSLLQYYVERKIQPKTKIELFHYNVFDFDFNILSKKYLSECILIVGNPPWVTNAELSNLNSNNLPTKSNFKSHNGIDAITGKGNFDIGEYITLMLLNSFQANDGMLAFLIKNSVVKNLLYDQKHNLYSISNLRRYSIDSKKEFDVSVEASLFTCRLNSIPEFQCAEFDFSRMPSVDNIFGWVNDKFVSSVEKYSHKKNIDGISPFEWRQGIKHDCSAIMELERNGKYFVNGFQDEVQLEDKLVYGFLKSSDLKKSVIRETRKYIIVTQQKVGQDTSYIKYQYPLTYQYLSKNKSFFEQRKSIIYKEKPDFSIFGIGDYSFKPYKIAISGLYKNYSFNLILPSGDKPIMLDDTCYIIGFDNIEFGAYSLILLNSLLASEFLQSISFVDAKRTFTKDVLMRVDLFALAALIPKTYIQKELDLLNQEHSLNITIDLWEDFVEVISPKESNQMSLFES